MKRYKVQFEVDLMAEDPVSARALVDYELIETQKMKCKLRAIAQRADEADGDVFTYPPERHETEAAAWEAAEQTLIVSEVPDGD